MSVLRPPMLTDILFAPFTPRLKWLDITLKHVMNFTLHILFKLQFLPFCSTSLVNVICEVFFVVKNLGKLADGPAVCMNWQWQVTVPFRPPIRYRCRWTSDSLLAFHLKFRRPKNYICTTGLTQRQQLNSFARWNLWDGKMFSEWPSSWFSSYSAPLNRLRKVYGVEKNWKLILITGK